MSNKPLGSSTPNRYYHVSHRRGVHSYNDEDFSPIVQNNTSGTASPQTRSPSSSDIDTGESDDETFRSSEGKVADVPNCSDDKLIEKENKGCNPWVFPVVAFIIIWVISQLVTMDNSSAKEKRVSLEDIKKEFPLQDEDFWISVESGLDDVVKLNKPSVFLFLYTENEEGTTERILRNISTYASCMLNNSCEKKAIVLISKELKNNKLLEEDNGYLLTKYKSELETVHVMIVKNLENIPGYIAKMLHFFCDEFSPVVKKSAFFLTLKVPSIPTKKLTYVKSLLKDNWHDINDDHFEALFTRISGMILTIKS